MDDLCKHIPIGELSTKYEISFFENLHNWGKVDCIYTNNVILEVIKNIENYNIILKYL